MAIFKYKALDDHGHEISGEIEADSKTHALELISLKGHIPESVKKKSGTLSNKKSSKKKLKIFLHQ